MPLLVLICACASVFLPACDEAQTAVGTPDAGLTEQEGVILEAVKALAERGDRASLTLLDTGDNPLLTLEMDGAEFQASLPLAWLPSEQDYTSARELFADAGAAGSELPNFESADMFPELRVHLGTDPESAARFAADVLELVHDLPPQDELVFESEDG